MPKEKKICMRTRNYGILKRKEKEKIKSATTKEQQVANVGKALPQATDMRTF